MKERVYSLDAIRVLACVMVIIMHAPIPNTRTESSLILGIVSYITAPCIGLFFMVSGALLLPIKENSISFLSKRLSKIIYPTLFWTLFYIVCNIIDNKMNLKDFFKSFMSIPFAAQGNGILWFMYTLIGLYLISPILSDWLKRNDESMIKLYLGIWAITLSYPYLQVFLDIQLSAESIFFYFSGYAGYFLLGYYLHLNMKTIVLNKLKFFGGLGIAFIPPILCKAMGLKLDFYIFFWYLSIGVALMCVIWFISLQNLHFFQKKSKLTCILTDISKLSFGIYFIHIFIMRNILWNSETLISLPYILQIPLCSILTFLLSFLIIKLISKLTFSKYIIGY